MNAEIHASNDDGLDGEVMEGGFGKVGMLYPGENVRLRCSFRVRSTMCGRARSRTHGLNGI